MHKQGRGVTGCRPLLTNTELTELMEQGYVVCDTDNARVNTKPRRNEQADTEVENTDFRSL